MIELNRAELRRMERENKKKKRTYVLTDDEIRQIKLNAAEDAAKIAVSQTIAVPVKVLAENFGQLMKKDGREERFANLCIDYLKQVESEEVELKDIVQWLHDTTGIKIGK